jgi:hypothetical protein
VAKSKAERIFLRHGLQGQAVFNKATLIEDNSGYELEHNTVDSMIVFG